MPVWLINDDDEQESIDESGRLNVTKFPIYGIIPTISFPARETLVDFGVLFQHGIVCVYFPNTWNQAHTESSPF